MHVTPADPGELVIPRGVLQLPQRLVVDDDRAIDIAWSDWETVEDRHVAHGIAEALRLMARVSDQQGGPAACNIEMLNMGEAPIELRELAWTLIVEKPTGIAVAPDDVARSSDPWDFNLAWETLACGSDERHLCVEYGDSVLRIGSPDFRTFGDGLIRCEPHAYGDSRIRISWHRVEPHWDYHGLFSTRPLNGLWINEGQTRSATILMACEDVPLERRVTCPARPDTDAIARTFPLMLLAEGRCDERVGRAVDTAERYRVRQGEYADLYAGGYDFRNGRQIELHVCRAEYGEFLLHEYLRRGDADLWRRVIAYAERFQQTAVNRSAHRQRGGAVRGRYGDNQTAHPIRSMRGAAFFWDMAELVGRSDFRETALGIADYLVRTFPWHNARQGAAVRDLMYLHDRTGDERYLDASIRIVERLSRAQRTSGGWYEYWDEDFEAFEYDPPNHHGGQWTAASTLKPEMASYNVNGMVDAMRIEPLRSRADLIPGIEEVVRRAADWLLEVQRPEGGWPFPAPDSRGIYGYGLTLDAAAMIKAGIHFQNDAYLASGRRALDYAFDLLDTIGHVPAVIGVEDVEPTECSMTWFYAIEALAALDVQSF